MDGEPVDHAGSGIDDVPFRTARIEPNIEGILGGANLDAADQGQGASPAIEERESDDVAAFDERSMNGGNLRIFYPAPIAYSPSDGSSCRKR